MARPEGRNSDVLFLWTYLMFLLVLASYFCAPIHHPNFYFHLLLGNWIRAHGALPTMDYWSAAGEGAPFYATNWAFDVAVSWIEQAWGEQGLLNFKLLLFVSFIGLIASALSRRSGSRFLGAALTALIAAGVFESSSLEPDVIGWGLFFFCFDSFLQLMRSENFARGLAKLFLLLIIYVNVHASAYLVIAGILAALPTASAFNGRQKTALAAAAALAAFCTPYLGGQLLPVTSAFFVELAHHALLHPRAGTLFHYPTAFVLLLWMLLLACLQQSPRSIGARELALLVLLTLGALMAVDYSPYAIIALGYAVAGLWGEVGPQGLGNLGRGIEAFRLRASEWDLKGIVWVLFCLVIVNGVQLFRLPLSLGGYPVKAMDFVVDRQLPGPILVDSRFAPYVAYRTSDASGMPSAKPAVDPRTPTLAFDLGRQMTLFERSGQGLDKFLSAAAPRLILCRTESLLCEVAARSAEWRLVFEWFKAVDDPEPLPEALRKGTSWLIYLPQPVPEVSSIAEQEG